MHIDFFTNSLHIIQGVVAACEIVNCNSIEVQCEVDEICFLISNILLNGVVWIWSHR